ncbi:MAG: VanW family protein [Clostridiales bacterium]|nr:VanW family protein [Clostridiales bacterium]
MADRMEKPNREDRPKGGFPFLSVILILLCLILWLLAAKSVLSLRDEYAAYKEKTARVLAYEDRIVPGVFVDGVDLAGMTREDAEAVFADRKRQKQADFTLTVRADGKQWRVTSSEVPMTFRISDVLDQAFLAGHTGTLDARLSRMDALLSEPLKLQTDYNYDITKIEDLVAKIASAVDVEAKDAALDAFDPLTKTFTFRPEAAGKKLNREKLAEDLLNALTQEAFDAPVEGAMEPVMPEIRLSDLDGRFGMISTFTTETTTDRDRNTNIRISSEALNGRVVQPGDTLSFNSCTGKRTYEKGYREAHAIVGGVLVDDTGGGVCQTSSTLFNAVVRADLAIVKRYAHSWPSIYVPRGEDATVNWPSRDFVFRNTSQYPVFLVAGYENRKVTVEVYGRLPDTWASIDLSSVTVRTTKPGNDTVYTLDESLPLGTRQQGHSKRTGYLVDTYKIWKDAEGNEIRKEKLWTTDYPATQNEILYH